jgi:hypothetical protein
MKRKRLIPLRCKGRIVGTVTNFSYEDQYPHDMLYHPSLAMKRLAKTIEEDDFNPSKREQRTLKQILDEVEDDTEFDNENDT